MLVVFDSDITICQLIFERSLNVSVKYDENYTKLEHDLNSFSFISTT